MSGKSFIAISGALLIALSCAGPLHGADKDFDVFWQKFKNAAQKNDKDALVSMTRCPFLFQGKQLTKTQLAVQIGNVLPAKTRRCLVTQHLQAAKDGAYMGFCGDLIYTFSKIDGRYMFTDIDAND
jgi:hypothetical protein